MRGPGRLDRLDHSVAVVGSRHATTYGAEVARGIADTLVRADWAVVSGAAYGIDQAAHRGALSVDGANVAVLACGVDRAYPTAHRALLDHLAQTSLVVAEVPPGCAPTRGRFLSRNRLIAALTRGTVVVEAAVRSGALNTATWATRLNRHLMGVPGPVTNAQSQGTHQLVRSGAATLVTQGSEVLEVVGDVGTHLVTPPRAPVHTSRQARSAAAAGARRGPGGPAGAGRLHRDHRRARPGRDPHQPEPPAHARARRDLALRVAAGARRAGVSGRLPRAASRAGGMRSRA